jgi:hypothetical protein
VTTTSMAAGSDPLVAAGSIQTSLFDTQNLAEVTDPRYPSERLIICHNPLLGEKRPKSARTCCKRPRRVWQR